MEYTLSVTALKDIITHAFPPDAVSWADATDEIRDMVGEARERAGLSTVPYSWAAMVTPADWNVKGVEMLIDFYQRLDEESRQGFCLRFEHWLKGWAWKWACDKYGR